MTLIRKCFFNKKSKKEFFIQKTYFKKNKTNYKKDFFKEFDLLLVLFFNWTSFIIFKYTMTNYGEF